MSLIVAPKAKSLVSRPLVPVRTEGMVKLSGPRQKSADSVGSSIDKLLAQLREGTKRTQAYKDVTGSKGLEETLYNSLASYKVYASRVSMHFSRDVRDKLFKQLDNLLDYEEWDGEDAPPSLASFQTFIRLLLMLKPARRPGLGVGVKESIIATWTVDRNTLTLECLPGDQVHWVLAREVGGVLERAAGTSSLARLPEVLRPWSPEIWLH